jgi:hypothetical protein
MFCDLCYFIHISVAPASKSELRFAVTFGSRWIKENIFAKFQLLAAHGSFQTISKKLGQKNYGKTNLCLPF